jgi:hypothetical protein
VLQGQLDLSAAVSINLAPVSQPVAGRVTEGILAGLLQEFQSPWSGYYSAQGLKGAITHLPGPQRAVSAV